MESSHLLFPIFVKMKPLSLTPLFFCWTLFVWSQVKPVKHGTFWGLEKNGKRMLTPKYDCIHFLDSCHVQLWYQGKTGVYNHCTDLWVSEIAYHSIEKMPSGEWLLQKGEKWGIANPKGLLYAPLTLEQKPIPLNDSTYLVKKEGQYYWFSRGTFRLPYSCCDPDQIDYRIRYRRPAGYKNALILSPNIVLWYQKDPFYLHDRQLMPAKGNWYLITPYHVMPITEWEYDSLGFVRISYFGKWGVIDRTGHIRIPFLYERIGPLHLGTFPYQLNGKWGLIDTQGNRLTFPRYDLIIPFHHHYLGKEKNLYWFLNQWGEILLNLPFSQVQYIPPHFYLIKILTPLTRPQHAFLNAHHLPIPRDYAFYVINALHFQMESGFTDALVTSFQDSLLIVQKDSVYILRRIQDSIPLLQTRWKPVFYHPSLYLFENPNQTLTAVWKDSVLSGNYLSLRQKEGYFILQGVERSLLFDSLWHCLTCTLNPSYQDFIVLEGWIWGVSWYNGYGLVDSQFHVVIQPYYDSIWEDGSYLFARQGSRFFLFNGEHFQELPYSGDSVQMVGCGVLAIQKQNRWYLYEMEDWTPLSPEKWLQVKKCQDGIIPVQTERGWNLLTLKGTYVSDSFFLSLSSGEGGYFYARTETGWGILDRSGHWIHPPTFPGADLSDPHHGQTFHVAVPRIALQKPNATRKGWKWVILDSTFQVYSNALYEPVTFLTPMGYGVIKEGTISTTGVLVSGKCSWIVQETPILRFSYDSIALWHPPFLLVKQGRYYGLIHLKTTKLVLPIQYHYISQPIGNHFLCLTDQGIWKVGQIQNDHQIQWLKASFDHVFAFTKNHIVGERKKKRILYTLSTDEESLLTLEEVKPLHHHPYFVIRDECFFRRYDPLFPK